MNFKEIITGYRGKDIPNELKAFNWGACVLTFIWGIRFKAWVTFLAIPLFFIKMPMGLNWILFCLFQLYCGIMGNSWAYQEEWWKTPADFRKTQIKWAVSALILTVLLPMIIGTFIVCFVKKSPDNIMDFVRNSQCVLANNQIKKGIPSISVSASPEEMANVFARRFKAEAQGNNVIFSIDSEKAKSYYISFERYSNAPCNFVDNNCIITSSYEFSTLVPIEPCVFYFDELKVIKPDESTQKALKKGTNIFKYL